MRLLLFAIGLLIAWPVLAEEPTTPAEQEQAPFRHLFSFRQDDIVTCAAFDYSSTKLATGSEVGTVIVADLQTETLTTRKDLHPEPNGVNCLKFSDDGQTLLTGGTRRNEPGGWINVVRMNDRQVAATLSSVGPQRGVPHFLGISNDGDLFIESGRTWVGVWDLRKKAFRRRIDFVSTACAFDGQSRVFLGVGTRRPTSEVRIPQPGKPGRSRIIPPAAGNVVVYDALTGHYRSVLDRLPKRPVLKLQWQESSGELVALLADFSVHWLDAKTGRVKRSLRLTEIEKAARARCKAQSVTFAFRCETFRVLKNQPIIVLHNRRYTFFFNYETKKLVELEHGSMVGLEVAPSGRHFAVLGGIENAALAGAKEQHYWTVNVFSLRPF